MPGRRNGAESALDAGLLARIAAGDRGAFEELYRRYRQRVFVYLLRVVGDVGAAEELANDVLVEVWHCAGTFRGQSRPSTWIFGIAHHKAVNALRRRRAPVEDAGALADVPDPGESADAAAIRHNLRERVRAALRALSPAHREVMELTFNEGFSCQEIAEIMGCPVNTVKTRMFHARRALRELLLAQGITPESL